MPMPKRRQVRLLLLWWVLLWQPVCAHNVWVAQRAGEWAIVLGEGALDDAYAPNAVRQVTAVDRAGHPAGLTLLPRERNVVLKPDGQAATLAVSYVDGYWGESVDGKWAAGSRRQLAGARKVGYYQMYSRTLIAAGASVGQALGLRLEIVPLADPFTLKRGDHLPVRVLFAGQPLAGVQVVSDYLNGGAGTQVTTDAGDYAVASIASGGLNVIKVSHTVPRAEQEEADEDGHSSTLAFALPQHE